MKGDSYGDGEHQALEPNRGEDIGTEEERGPQETEDIHLDPKGNDLVLGEAADVVTQARVLHQPVVHTARAAVVTPGGKQQQWRGGQHGQEDADDAQHEAEGAEKKEEDFHFLRFEL